MVDYTLKLKVLVSSDKQSTNASQSDHLWITQTFRSMQLNIVNSAENSVTIPFY